VRALLPALLALLAVSPALAQLDSRLGLGGSYEFYSGLRLDREPDLLTVRNRAELLLTFDYDRGRIALRPRLDYDALGETLDGDLREAFIDVYFSRVDLRLGRQQIVWGETDGTFVTDLLSPLDLTEFLAQPFDDLRLGVTAATATWYASDDVRLTGVLVPRRPTTRLPQPGSAWYPLPRRFFEVLPVEITEPAPQDSTLRGAETALRLTYTGFDRTDVAVLWINGFNRLPAFRKGLAFDPATPRLFVAVTPEYRRRQVVGLTAETLLLDPVVLRAEAAFHTSYLFDQPIELPMSLEEIGDLFDLPLDLPFDPDDFTSLLDPDFRDAVERGFLIEKPFAQSAVGVERVFGRHLFRVQGIGSFVFDWDERVAQDRFEAGLTGFWTAPFRRQTLTAQAFVYYNVGEDYWLNPSLTYAVQDALNATVGAHVFGGAGGTRDLVGLLREPAFSFATYDANDFVYLRVAYSF
jgi:hypothetical protein